MEKPDLEHLNQGTEVNITSDVTWGSFISEMIGEGHFTFAVFFPKHLLPQRNHAKKDKFNLRDILQYTCMHLKTVKVIKYTADQQSEATRDQDEITKYSVVFWTGSWNTKRILQINCS